MKISELKAGQGKVDIEIKIKSKGEVRTFNKYGRDLRVCNLVAQDDSGEMKLSLWNDDIDKVNVGDTVKITNGYVSDFNGEKQLTSGKFGKMEVVTGGASAADVASPSLESKKPKEKPSKKKAEEKNSDKIEETEF